MERAELVGPQTYLDSLEDVALGDPRQSHAQKAQRASMKKQQRAANKRDEQRAHARAASAVRRRLLDVSERAGLEGALIVLAASRLAGEEA